MTLAEADVAIVGAGPAGLFAALETCFKAGGRVKVAIIEMGRRASERRCPAAGPGGNHGLRRRGCVRCSPCQVLHGVGGAGALSSGTINLRPDVGGDLHKLLGSWEEAEALIKYVDEVFLRFGAPKDRLYVIDEVKAAELERLAARAGARFIPTPQRHIGSENTVRVVEAMTDYLERSCGVKLLTGVKALDLRVEGSHVIIETTAGEVRCSYAILAPGRGGASWFADLARRRGIEVEPGPLDIGVRVEVPAYILEPVTKLVRDPKIILYTRVYDDRVRTFCTNPNGYVVMERYEDGVVGVNGESYATLKSRNTNFALLVTLELSDPLEDTVAYGMSVGRLAAKLGGGKPIIQRLGDLEAGRRSTWARIGRSSVEPTLKDVTPGDIGMALPYRVMADLREALRRLDSILPGVASPETLLYAPEIKFYSVRAKVGRDLETSLRNVFVAGDGAGLSRGINVAAATGVLAARSVLARMGFEAG